MNIAVNSLASLKRAIATPNVLIRVKEHWQEQLRGTTRTPEKVQGNGYYFRGPNLKGIDCRMWAPTPKASELRFNEDGSVTYYPDTSKSWTLQFEASSGLSETVLYGIPRGSTERYEEVLLLTKATPETIEKVKTLATKDGFHSFRVATIDLSTPPDFSKTMAQRVSQSVAHSD